MPPTDTTALLDEANDLVDGAETRAKGLDLLRTVVKREPGRVDAAYYLAFALLVTPQAPGAEELAEARELLSLVVEGTIGARPPAESDEPSVEARARSFALAWPLPARCVEATENELTELARIADEAHALRASIYTQAALRAVRMGAAWAGARSKGRPEVGFQHLLDWVAAHPLHSPFANASWMTRDESSYPPSQTMSSAGLDPFFEDPTYLAWVGAKKKVSAPALPGRLLLDGLCAAAGEDHGGTTGMRTGTGRRGRILSLLALGATLEGRVPIPTIGANNPLTSAARFADAATARFLVELGADVNRLPDPPLLAAVVYGEVDAIKLLLELGADPMIEIPHKGGVTDGPIKRAAKNKAVLALLRGGKSAPAPKKKAGALDTGPARAAWKARKTSFGKAKWADGDEDLDAFFDLLDVEGVATWEAAAAHLASLDPNELLALALVLGDVQPKLTKTPAPRKLTKKDHNEARIVTGDAVVVGDALLGGGTDWVIAGALALEGRFANDEAARIAVGGDLTGTMVETEGELLVGGDLMVDEVVWAEYEAGTLVVGGTLKTKVLIEKRHAVVAAKRRVEHRLKDTSVAAAGKLFPAKTFAGDTLDGKKLWAALKPRA